MQRHYFADSSYAHSRIAWGYFQDVWTIFLVFIPSFGDVALVTVRIECYVLLGSVRAINQHYNSYTIQQLLVPFTTCNNERHNERNITAALNTAASVCY